MTRSLAHGLSRYKLKFDAENVNTMIIKIIIEDLRGFFSNLKAISFVEDLDRIDQQRYDEAWRIIWLSFPRTEK